MKSVQWNIKVSSDIDRSLRMFLASQGDGREVDLSPFIEEAVRAQLFNLSVEQAEAATAHLSEVAVIELVDEALAWERKR